MQAARYNPVHRLIQKLAASPPGSWLLARSLHLLDRFVRAVSGGRLTLTSLLTGLPVMWVTTTGARSGQPRTHPLVPIPDPEHPGRWALIASNFGQRHFPAWYYNLKQHPQAACELGSGRLTFRAREATGEEYERFWRYALDAYFGYASYKQRAGRRIPIMLLEQEPPADIVHEWRE